ncbi:MAG: hypothetical protein JW801_15475 [Bacteroidales bacterium]|nr:hypothetical protein [Bacteroidales bacterium]
MASKIPKIRSINYYYFIPQAAIIILLIYFFFLLEVTHYKALGISIYFLLSIYLKVLIPKWHKKGIFLIKKGKLELAILSFQRSYDYFKRNAWIDSYRAFTLLSTSKDSYQEMALINIIYCFEQLGDKKSARKYHQLLRERFPDNRYV